jgi:predicted dienelactone hydrolase
VKAGYVVAAPAFPKTRHGAPGGLDATDYRNEPADVAFVITQLVAQAAGPGPLAQRIDTTRIAVAGHSLGAEVVLGLLNTCCREPRAVAAISLAGSEQFNPGQPAFPLAGYFAGIRVPVLFVHGDADTDNPYSRSRDAFNQASAPKFLETILGGDHRIPYQGDPVTQPAARAVTAVTIDFLDAYLKGQADAGTRLRADGTQAGVARLEAVT